MNFSLSRITAFQFENFLWKIKKKLRTPKRPLAQVRRRLYEERYVKSKKTVTLPQLLKVLATAANHDVIKIRFNETTITTNSPNNMILLRNGNIISAKRMFFDNENLQLQGKIWNKKKPILLLQLLRKNLIYWIYIPNLRTDLLQVL